MGPLPVGLLWNLFSVDLWLMVSFGDHMRCHINFIQIKAQKLRRLRLALEND